MNHFLEFQHLCHCAKSIVLSQYTEDHVQNTEFLVHHQADFSDVVEWLKTNASSSTQNVVASFSRGVIPSVDKQVHEEDKKTEFSFQSGNESKKPGFTSPFTGPWSFGLNAASQSSPTLGLLARPPIPPIETEGASNDQEEGKCLNWVVEGMLQNLFYVSHVDACTQTWTETTLLAV
eukprot:Gb_26200 [translate_table: standard]